MRKERSELTWSNGPDALMLRMRELAREGTWEAFIALIGIRDEIPPTELTSWREAADDCLERYLSTAPGRHGTG
jgi:hypothetical protein